MVFAWVKSMDFGIWNEPEVAAIWEEEKSTQAGSLFQGFYTVQESQIRVWKKRTRREENHVLSVLPGPYIFHHMPIGLQKTVPCQSPYPASLCSTQEYVAQLIKTQRQILGFSLKVWKAKQVVTDSYLYLSLKWWFYLQESQNETESCLFSFYISLQGWDQRHEPLLSSYYGKLLWLLCLKVCVITAWSVRLTSGVVLVSDLQVSFIYWNTNEISLQE